MPVSDASVSALKKYLSIFSDGDSVAAAQSQLAEQQKAGRPCFPRSCARFSGGGLWHGGSKPFQNYNRLCRQTRKDSEALGALGRAYSQKGDRANAVANLEKALALDPHSSNNDKWNSLLKVNRYWLAIQQGDAALKANNPDRAERLFQHARNVDNTDSYAVLGAGRCGDGAKRLSRRRTLLSADAAHGKRQYQRRARAGEYLPPAVARKSRSVYRLALCQPAAQY